ncbi:MAG: hypothetical protein ACK56I_01620, partial [bacterium]
AKPSSNKNCVILYHSPLEKHTQDSEIDNYLSSPPKSTSGNAPILYRRTNLQLEEPFMESPEN